MPSSLPAPHGGTLCNLLAAPEEIETLKEAAIHYPSWTLNDRQLCDLELLLTGGFSPLQGFMNKADYTSVVETMRLQDGTFWPIPITLDIPQTLAATLSPGDNLALRDKEGFVLAILTLEDIWQNDHRKEAELVFGTLDDTHPAVNYLLHEAHPYYLSGKLVGIHLPKQYDYKSLRHTPTELRQKFQEMGWERIVAFQTRNPLHRAHVEMTLRACEEHTAHLLIHPVVGLTKPGDVDHFTRVRCYQKVLSKYPSGLAFLSLLPLAMRMGGPREALWHAIIRKNYGCTHFIIGRDHASPGKDKNGKPFYGPYDAQDLFRAHEEELGIQMVPFKMMVYLQKRKVYVTVDQVPEDDTALNISGTDLRRRLDLGEPIPEWFSYPEVVAELRHARPELKKRGFTVFFTGLSGAGKSTLAQGLLVKLMEDGRRPVTLLDGDIVRTHLSSELGFSQEHRSLNVRRIGFVASEITKNGGVAICAPIAPYRADRRFNRELITPLGGFIEVYVSTPLDVCEHRDVKGLYAKARKGLLHHFTGIDDPYEPPENPEITIDSSSVDPESLVDEIMEKIRQLGYL